MKGWVFLPVVAVTLVAGACGASTVGEYYKDIPAQPESVTVSSAPAASVGHSVKGTPARNTSFVAADNVPDGKVAADCGEEYPLPYESEGGAPCKEHTEQADGLEKPASGEAGPDGGQIADTDDTDDIVRPGEFAADDRADAAGGGDGIWIDPADYPGQRVYVNDRQVEKRTLFTGSIDVRVRDSRGDCYEWSRYV